ncbi:hypothetical protein STANM309S_00703 [Streptomyces tanashiensis]
MTPGQRVRSACASSGRLGDDVLAVVEDEERPAPGAVLDEGREPVLRCRRGDGRRLPELGLAGPQRGQDGGGDRGLLADGGEFGEVDGALVRPGRLQGEPCLADAARPGEGDEPSSAQAAASAPSSSRPADERGQAGGKAARGPGPGGPPGRYRTVLREEFGVQGAQFRPRIGAEPVRERRAYLLVRGEGLGGPPGRSQGADPQGLEGFVERLPGGERGERREDGGGPPQGEVGGEPVAPRLGVPLLDPYDQGVGVPAGQVREGGPAPQSQGLVEERGGGAGVAVGEGGGALGGEPFEEVQVDGVRAGGDPVAAAGGRDDGLAAQGAAQAADEGLERRRAVLVVGGIAVGPDLVDQRSGAHGASAGRGERGEEGPEPGPAQGGLRPVVGTEGLTRTENTVGRLHRPILPRRAGRDGAAPRTHPGRRTRATPCHRHGVRGVRVRQWGG